MLRLENLLWQSGGNRQNGGKERMQKPQISSAFGPPKADGGQDKRDLQDFFHYEEKRTRRVLDTDSDEGGRRIM